MNPHFLGLRTCVFNVTDLAAARDWYAKVLDQPAYFDEPFYVGFEVSGYELGLIPMEPNVNIGENVNIYWGVENVDATFARLLALGAQSHEQPNEVGGGIKVAAIKDPWGNVFGIIFNPHFKLP